MARLSDLHKAYMRERRRIQSYLRRYKKLGVEFDYELPNIPKKITEGSIRRLKKTTPKELQRKAYIATPETGEVITGRKAIQTAKHARQVDIVLQNIENMINQWSPQGNWTSSFVAVKEGDKNTVKKILEGAIARDGREAVAKRIEGRAERINELVQYVLYASGSREHHFGTGRNQVNIDLVELSGYINGRSLTAEEAMLVQAQVDEYRYF